MSKTLALPFGEPARARATDPLSSHDAADAVSRSGQATRQQRAALSLVLRFPWHTTRELAVYALQDGSYAPCLGTNEAAVVHVLGRRLPELRDRWLEPQDRSGGRLRWTVREEKQQEAWKEVR